MVFAPVTELLLNGAWTAVTSDVRQADGIRITRGRSSEASNAEPSTCSLTFDNRAGKYSPRNPTSPYYGVLGRNTQMRVRTPTTAENYMSLDAGDPFVVGGWSSRATTPDIAALDITGDLDVRIDVEPRTWRPTVISGLAQKYVISGNQRSWAFWITSTGTLIFRWSNDGLSQLGAESTVAIPATTGRLALRATIDVDNGAAGRTITFYTAPTINDTWTILGSAVVQAAGVTSIFSSTAPVDVGLTNATTTLDSVMQGKVYAFRLRNGIAGTVVANPDFTAQDSHITAFTDASGKAWSLAGTATITNPGARFHGEVSSWPPKWDVTHRNAWTPVEASGVMRRLSQGQPPVRSTMRRYFDSQADVVAYWPCEDPEGATEIASALDGAQPMTHLSGELAKAQYDQFTCSDPIPLAGTVQWEGVVPSYTYTGVTQVQFLMAIPSGGVTSTSTILRLFGSGTAPWWKLNVNTGGQLRFLSYDYDDGVHEDTGFVGANLNGRRVTVVITFSHTGANIDWTIKVYAMGDTATTVSLSGTQVSQTFGRMRRVNINMEDSILDSMAEVAIGQIVVRNALTPWGAREVNMGIGYSGETAAQRILRLCVEEGQRVTLVGDPLDATFVGAQRSATFLEIIQEAAEADMGILYEPRGFLGLAYRTRASLYAQDAAVTLDYEAGTLSSIEPVEDDDATRNDITVTRVNGSSARVVEEAGPLSVLEPPNGVGRYDDEVTVNLWRDSYLPGQAQWRLHLGTVDEARYPVLGVDLAATAFTSDAGLSADAESLDVGSRLVVSNPPSSVPPEDIAQLVQGMTETLDQFHWTIDVNCAPSSPYDVAVWDDSSGVGEARYSSDGTTISAAVPASGSALVLTGVSPGRASTPDTAALDIVGDIDIRVQAALDDWTPASTNRALVSKWGAGTTKSFIFSVVATTGRLRMQWTADGASSLQADSTVSPTVTDGQALWVRATLDVNNGAAGRDIRFYTSTDGETWTQLGTTVTQAGTTSIFSGSAPVEVGSTTVGVSNVWPGKVSAVEIRSTIDGTVVARPEFGAQPAGTTVFVDAYGLTWTVTAPATIAAVANTLFPDTLLIFTPSGPVWGTADLPYDITIGGERMTVTALTGTSFGQIMTVVRSVNGIVKGHATGADVGLHKPALYAL